MESGVADCESECARGKPGFAQAFAGFLRKVTEHRFHFRNVAGVFPERVIVGDGLGLCVDKKFVGIASARLAEERRAPLAKDGFQFFLRVRGEMLDGLDGEGAQGAFCNFANARNFADGKWGEETCFHPRGYPD